MKIKDLHWYGAFVSGGLSGHLYISSCRKNSERDCPLEFQGMDEVSIFEKT